MIARTRTEITLERLARLKNQVAKDRLAASQAVHRSLVEQRSAAEALAGHISTTAIETCGLELANAERFSMLCIERINELDCLLKDSEASMGFEKHRLSRALLSLSVLAGHKAK